MAESVAELRPWVMAGKGEVSAASLEKWGQARLAAQQQAVDRLLAAGRERRTVENTLRPYDDAVAELSAAASQAGLLNSVHPLKEVRDAAQDWARRIAEAATALSLNQAVYNALREIDRAWLDPATQHYIKRTLLEYRLAGVDKDEATRQRIHELRQRATELSLDFSRNVQEGAQHVTVTGKTELEGLPEDFLQGHAPGPDGSIVLSTDYPDYMPVMTFARSAALRERMFLAYNTRAYPQNQPILLELLAVRQELAAILGFNTWADLATADQMIQSSAGIKTLIDELERVSRDGARREYEMVLEFAQQQEPGLAALDAAGRGYWYELYRRSAFAFDSQAVRPYFPYSRVQKGILETAERLFQVSFERVRGAEVWHSSVTAWDVLDGSGTIGRFYLDMHPREGKDKWFSAAPLIPGIAGSQLPEAALICNFPGGKPDDPGLMQYSDVVTYFHEFGHLMHAILGGRQAWAGVSGIATEGDFVEVPSQMLEEFFRDPALLASFALHYQTNQPIPAALVARMNRASSFGRCDWLRTQLFYTSYSLDVHSLPAGDLNLDALLRAGYERLLPYRWIEGNRMFSSFGHLVGYSSNYYTYLYDKVIALDFFNQFSGSGLLQSPAAERYRRQVLEPGGSKPGKEIVLDFLDRPHNFEAFQKWLGEEFAAQA